MFDSTPTIHRRWRFCFVEKRGARICFDGRSQSVQMVSRSEYGQLLKIPTEHGRMYPVEVRNEQRRCQDNEKNMSEQEVRTPQRHFDDLHDVLASRLRQGRVTKTATVPLAGPPGPIGLVVLVLTRQEDGDDNLLNGALNGNNADNPENSVRCVP
jgi:hypothetical protein